MYLAVLGREPELSTAELEAVFGEVKKISDNLALFESKFLPDINKLGGSLKLAVKLDEKPLKFLSEIDGKITIGVSDYSRGASKKTAMLEAMKLKKILVRHGKSVRVVLGEVVISTATSLHNGLSGKNPKKCELIKVDNDWYRVIGVQDIDAYSRRDQGRPARDAKVGMLPPKLAQILVNLCGRLKKGAVVLDPFCGTGVLLQEAILMGYFGYGTDISEKMVDFSRKNLEFLGFSDYKLEVGSAIDHKWSKIDAVACEGYLGKPMSKLPSEMEVLEQKHECTDIILGFLQNLAEQIPKNTPVVIAAPAWLCKNGGYERLEILDEINKLGYNVSNKTCEGLFYYREGQIVARDIIILRKK